MGMLRDLGSHAKKFMDSIFGNHPEQEVEGKDSEQLMNVAASSISINENDTNKISKEEAAELISKSREIDKMAKNIETSNDATVILDSTDPGKHKEINRDFERNLKKGNKNIEKKDIEHEL